MYSYVKKFLAHKGISYPHEEKTLIMSGYIMTYLVNSLNWMHEYMQEDFVQAVHRFVK
jgi:hypothetical protein